MPISQQEQQNQIERRREPSLPGPAGFGAVLCLIAAVASVQACAGPIEAETTSAATSTGPGGGGVGGEGGAGGGPACEAGVTEDCYTGPAGTKDVGLCKGGTRTCNPGGVGWSNCAGEVVPAAETCATMDDEDCDGMVNEEGEACLCVPGETQPCYTGPEGTEGVGQCAAGAATCNELGTGFGACEGEVGPAPEDCSNVTDDDCDKVACAAPLWGTIFGGPMVDQPAGVAVDSTGNIYVGGVFSDTMAIGAEMLVSAGGTDGFLVKFDATGVLQWAQAFGDAADQAVLTVAVDPADDVYVGGYFAGTLALGGMGGVTYTANGRDAFVAKLGTTGAYLWSKRLGIAGNQAVTALAVNAAGEIGVGGTFEDTLICPFGCIKSQGGQDIFFVKYNGAGQQLMVKTFGAPTEQLLNSLVYDPSGNLILAGQLQGDGIDFGGGAPLGSAGGYDAFVVKLDPMGVHLWSKRFGDPLEQRAVAVTSDPAGNVILTGGFFSSINFGALDIQSAGLSDIFVVKLDPDGAYLWANTYGDASDQVAGGVGADAAGNIVLTGGFQGMVNFGGGPLTSAVSYDFLLLKLNGMGGYIWGKGYGSSASQIGGPLYIYPATGEILVAGAAAGSINFGAGDLTSAGVEDVVITKITP